MFEESFFWGETKRALGEIWNFERDKDWREEKAGVWALWFTLRGAEGGLRGPVLCFGMGSGGGALGKGK